MTSEIKREAMAGAVELLELTASLRSELLDFQLDSLRNSPVRFAVLDLAANLGVPEHEIAATIYQACHDLDQLVATRRVWRDPGEILPAPNVAALFHVCQARSSRTTGPKRGRLEITLRRLRKAYELLQSRAWIEAFLGDPWPQPHTGHAGED